LRYLNISRNNIDCLDDLSPLGKLEVLIADSNAVDALNNVKALIKKLPMLKKVSFKQNPAQKDRDYLKSVVLSSQSISK
jgi:hypothetical protein